MVGRRLWNKLQSTKLNCYRILQSPVDDPVDLLPVQTVQIVDWAESSKDQFSKTFTTTTQNADQITVKILQCDMHSD